MTEYRAPFFERLRQLLAQRGVKLHVAYGTPAREEVLRRDSGVLPWGIQVFTRYLRLLKLRVAFQWLPTSVLKAQDLVVAPHENGFLLNYWLMLVCALTGRRLAFWGHGANFQSNRPGGFLERFKKWTARRCDWWFAYTDLSFREIKDAGFPEDRITVINNAIDMAELLRWRDAASVEELADARNTLGLQGGKVGIFLGSLTKQKRLEFLFAAADELHRRLPDFELIIIGDGPMRRAVQEYVAARPWCKWLGALHGRDKVLHLMLGQVMLNPGMVGLGILDSFALGIPLVTTGCNIHSPEISYLESGRNGLMVPDDLEAFVGGVSSLMENPAAWRSMSDSCIEAGARYTLENMAQSFCAGIVNALGLKQAANDVEQKSEDDAATRLPAHSPGWHIAVLWQRFLPYHIARIRRLQERCSALGYRLTAIEVAAQENSYGFARNDFQGEYLEYLCCLPGANYHECQPDQINASVLNVLNDLEPDLVFSPATAFPEGMAAVMYRISSGNRLVLMDDAWEGTDRRGLLTKAVKRLIHRNVDGVFVPAVSHLPYYMGLGFRQEQVIFGVDVVDNAYFAEGAVKCGLAAATVRESHDLSKNYFLFVGRFIRKKGVEHLIEAYRRYRLCAEKSPWDLVLVGSGPQMNAFQESVLDIPGIHFVGPKFGDDLRTYYALARAAIIPSILDQWGLVVNEALASGLPVIVSRGCGAARSLVFEGQNGWTFEPGDVDELARLMASLAESPPDVLEQMGIKSQAIIAEWSLDRFAAGALQALHIPRRMEAGVLSKLAARAWRGRVSVT